MQEPSYSIYAVTTGLKYKYYEIEGTSVRQRVLQDTPNDVNSRRHAPTPKQKHESKTTTFSKQQQLPSSHPSFYPSQTPVARVPFLDVVREGRGLLQSPLEGDSKY